MLAYYQHQLMHVILRVSRGESGLLTTGGILRAKRA